MSDSKYLLDLAAENYGWTMRYGNGSHRYERPGFLTEVFFTIDNRVHSCYFTDRSATVQNVSIYGGFPAVAALLKKHGNGS